MDLNPYESPRCAPYWDEADLAQADDGPDVVAWCMFVFGFTGAIVIAFVSIAAAGY